MTMISVGLRWVLLMLRGIRPIIQEKGPRPRTRKRKVFPILVVISLVGTISEKSLKFLPPDVIF